MTNDVSNRIVQKLWSYCNVLRDDGLSYQDYPHILAQEIADDLRSALGQIEDILGDLERRMTANDTTPRGA